MADRRKTLGDFGEQYAAGYLARQGMQLLGRKWRCRAGEIDLVLRDGDALVFVEVRARRAASADTAVESVGPHKRARLAELAYAYLEAHALPQEQPWRIDVVALAVDRAGRVAQLAHIRDAVEG